MTSIDCDHKKVTVAAHQPPHQAEHSLFYSQSNVISIPTDNGNVILSQQHHDKESALVRDIIIIFVFFTAVPPPRERCSFIISTILFISSQTLNRPAISTAFTLSTLAISMPIALACFVSWDQIGVQMVSVL